MKKIITIIVTVFIMLSFSGSGFASLILDFDDITTGTSAVITNPYNGYTFYNTNVWSDSKGYDSSAYGQGSYSTPSGDYAAVNKAQTVVITVDGSFDFEGAYFAALLKEGTPYERTAQWVTVSGFSGDTQIGTEKLYFTEETGYDFVWLFAGFNGIDRLEISTSINDAGYGWWLMDDFTDNFYPNNGPTEQIPEPGTLLLLGLCFIGLAGTYRFKK